MTGSCSIPSATRIGIATAYTPNSKYKVYWAMVVAADSGSQRCPYAGVLQTSERPL